jgi:hypothetical protein
MPRSASPSPKPGPPVWRVRVPEGRELTVKAYTRGEARAKAKRLLGLNPRERLPDTIEIWRALPAAGPGG